MTAAIGGIGDLSGPEAAGATPSPPIAVAIAAQTWKQGKAVSFTLPSKTFTDPQRQTLTYSATLADGSALPSWLTFNATTHSFTGLPPAGSDFSITVTATDTSGLSASETFLVTLLDAPVVLSPQIASQSWTPGHVVDFVLPAGTFSDPQSESLTYSAKQSNGTPLPSWLHVNAATGEITGTAPASVPNMVVIETAKDSSGLSAAVGFAVTGGYAPILAHHESNQTFKQGQSVALSLINEFSESQHGSLSYTATLAGGAALPAWLTFHASNDTLTGTVPATSGTIVIQVTATNKSGLSTTDSFKLTTLAAPVVNDQTATQTFLAGAENSFTLAADTFVDPQGQKMTYKASLANGSALPYWLHFNSTTETFSGTPKVGNLTLGAIEALSAAEWQAHAPKPLTIEVFAHDASGLTAHETFTLNFTNVPLVGV